MRPISTSRSALILLACLCMCARSNENNTSHSFRMYEENGVSIAESTGGPKYMDELFTYEEIAKVTEDERAESLLLSGGTPQIDENGYFFVPNRISSELWFAVFDSEGTYQYRFGAKGQGPGEFIVPRITYIGNGQIEFFDHPLQRITLYRTDGILLETMRPPPTSISSMSDYIYRTEDGGFLAVSKTPTRTEGGRSVSQKHVEFFNSDWNALWSMDTEKIYGGRRISGGRTHGYAYIPFKPDHYIFYHPALGVLTTTGHDPVLSVYSLDGNIKLRIDLGLPSQPVTSAEKDSITSRLRERVRTSSGDAKEWARAILDNIEYPEIKAFWAGPFFQTVQVDDNGYIWIRIPPWSPDSGSSDGSTKYRIVSPEGEYLGITAPPRHRPALAIVGKGYIVIEENDEETGERIITSYRIRPSVSELSYN